MRTLCGLLVILLGGALTLAEDKKEPAAKPAKVVVTAEAACLHCHFGTGDACAVCLKLDDKTPLVVEGKAAEELFKVRMKKPTYVVEGVLKLKDKQMILVAEKCMPFEEKSKEKVPGKGLAYLEGPAICGMCDLSLCDECTLAFRNEKTPIILDGELARDHAGGKGTIGVTGKLQVDKNGRLRVVASKVDVVDTKK
jgi:hypothetical protein